MTADEVLSAVNIRRSTLASTSFDPLHSAILSMDLQSGIVSVYSPDGDLVTRAGTLLRHGRDVGLTIVHVKVGFRPTWSGLAGSALLFRLAASLKRAFGSFSIAMATRTKCQQIKCPCCGRERDPLNGTTRSCATSFSLLGAYDKLIKHVAHRGRKSQSRADTVAYSTTMPNNL